MQHRDPTDDEREAVLDALAALMDDETARAYREGYERDHYPLIVVENYTTDAPGYSGPVAVQLHGNGQADVFGLFQKEGTGEIDRAEPLNPVGVGAE